MKSDHLPFFSQRKLLTKEAHVRSLKYSTSVRFWKMMLPLIAVAALGVLFAWPYLEEHLDVFADSSTVQPRAMPEITVTNKLLNPRLDAIDAKGRPITLRAESAIQTSDQGADMVQPESQINLENGQQITVKSAAGHYNQAAQSFQYKEQVELQSQDGLKLQTSSAFVDLKTNQAEGHAPVTGEGPSGTVQSEGFKIMKEGKEIHLLGKSKLTITGKGS